MAEYIKREALEVALNHRLSFLMAENSEYDHYTSGYDEAVDTVENFPSAADVAPVVHSYWEHKITSSGENIGICHNCKYPVNWFWKRTKYCPNCGAKMDGSDGDAAD